MQQKRVVLILILSIGLATFLVPPLTSSTMINQEFSTISSTSNDNLTIISPSEPITWYKDSKVNLIIWTITNNTRDTISFDVIRNGTVEYSGMAEQIPFLHSIHVFHRVPISEMDYGTYNYTLVATDSVENKSATIILNLIEGASNTINPLLYALIFPALIGGVAVLYLVIFRFSPLNRYFGGTSCSEA